VLEQRQCAGHVVEVVQRLAHPHEHQVGGPAPGQGRGAVDLLDDLPRRQVAAEAEGGRGAERAVERATDLRGDAEGQLVALLVLVGDQHRLDRPPVVGLEAQLARPVARGLDHRLAERHERVSALERAAQRARDVGHLGRVRDPLGVQPAKDLLGPIAGRAGGGHQAPEVVRQQRPEVAPGGNRGFGEGRGGHGAKG